MASRKTPSKATASRAAKVLKSKKSSKSAKSSAGRTLALRSASKPRIKSTPKRGKVSKATIRRVVRLASRSKRTSSKKR